MSQGIAPSTRKVYLTAESLFVEFCRRINRAPMPASEGTLILFATELAQTREQATVKVYLAGVRHLHIVNGWANPLASTPRLDLVLKGIRRMKPKQERPHLPVTPAIMAYIHQGLWARPLPEFDRVMIWAACTLAFFGFLRCRFTQASLTSYDQRKHLSLGDVAVDSHESPSRLAVRIKSSKVDQFGQGVTIALGKGSNTLCPVAAMLQYLAN